MVPYFLFYRGHCDFGHVMRPCTLFRGRLGPHRLTPDIAGVVSRDDHPYAGCAKRQCRVCYSATEVADVPVVVVPLDPDVPTVSTTVAVRTPMPRPVVPNPPVPRPDPLPDAVLALLVEELGVFCRQVACNRPPGKYVADTTVPEPQISRARASATAAPWACDAEPGSARARQTETRLVFWNGDIGKLIYENVSRNMRTFW